MSGFKSGEVTIGTDGDKFAGKQSDNIESVES